MFRLIKGLVWAEAPAQKVNPPNFQSPAVLYLIPNPANNYLRRCLFQQAFVTLAAPSDILTVTNLMHDPTQGTLAEVSFEVLPEMDMCLYQVVDDNEVKHGFKFINTQAQPTLPEASVIALEFDDEETATAFQSAVAYILHSKEHPRKPYNPADAGAYVEFEGLQRPEDSEKRNYKERAELTKTVADIPAQIPQAAEASLYPEFRDSDEEDYPEIPQVEQEKAQRLEFARLAVQELSHLYSLPQLLFMSPAHLYEYSVKSSQFTLIGVNLAFVLVRPQPQTYSLEIVQAGSLLLKTSIGKDFTFEADPSQSRFRWRARGRLWECVLADDVSRLAPLLARAIVEAEYEADFEVAFPDPSDQQYLLGTGEDSQMMSIAGSVEADVDAGAWVEEENMGFMSGEKITDSAQGHTGSIIFATRQNRIDVLKSEGEEFHQVSSGIGPLVARNQESVAPGRLLVYQQDSKGLLYDSVHKDIVYCTDLQRGQIVEEWKLPTPVTQLSTVFKFAEKTPEQNVLALGPAGVFELDPRLSTPSKIAREKTYKSAMDFTCIAANPEGGFAVGNEKGEIRLFKEPGQIAKTQLPGLGKRLIGLEVTADGEWVLGTAANCLMLVPVLSHGKNGFIARLGADKRPITPFNISLEDQTSLGIKELSYTPAHFNSSPEGQETAIVTSTGPFLITWDFQKLKKRLKTKNYRGCYTVTSMQITKVADLPVRNDFRVGTDSQVLVTMPSMIALQKRMQGLKLA
jgi:hypothetical protein